MNLLNKNISGLPKVSSPSDQYSDDQQYDGYDDYDLGDGDYGDNMHDVEVMGLNPQIKTLPTSINVDEGKTVRLPCEVEDKLGKYMLIST